jgi:uncharacterized protein YjbJ (UPF0337 family)
MDENRITGTARNLGGKVEEGVGRFGSSGQAAADAEPGSAV